MFSDSESIVEVLEPRVLLLPGFLRIEEGAVDVVVEVEDVVDCLCGTGGGIELAELELDCVVLSLSL
jgi:hypothetical protein